MRKRVFGRKFNKDKNQRQVLFKGLMRSLALHEGIKTTESKAKAIKGDFEKMITKAKMGEDARYHLVKNLPEDAVDRLIKEIAPRFKNRAGGYTRIIRLGNRLKDNAEMVLLELVEKGAAQSALPGGRESTTTKKKIVAKKAGIKESGVKVTTEAPKLKVGAIKRLVSRQKKGQA